MADHPHDPNTCPRCTAMMQALARAIDETLNGAERKGNNGFVLLTFRFGETSGGRVNYVSNAQRADMLTAMKEFIARAEGRYEDTDMVQ